MKNRVEVALVALAVSLAASVPAFAVVDVSDVVDEIATGAAPIAAIGGAVLLILGGVKLWKLVRRAM